jgi:hypothetical protein
MANEITSQVLLIEKLRHQVAGQNKHRFKSKGESIFQLQLRKEGEEVAEAAATPAEPIEHAVECVKAKPKRKLLPEHLPLCLLAKTAPTVAVRCVNWDAIQQKSWNMFPVALS